MQLGSSGAATNNLTQTPASALPPPFPSRRAAWEANRPAVLACLEDLKGAITRTTEQVAGYHRQMGVLRDALYLHSQVLLGWVRWGRVAVRVGPGEAHAVAGALCWA